VKSEQYDDVERPKHRMLDDDEDARILMENRAGKGANGWKAAV